MRENGLKGRSYTVGTKKEAKHTRNCFVQELPIFLNVMISGYGQGIESLKAQMGNG